MKPSSRYGLPPIRNDCRHTRLAESPMAAVDLCACGMMQIHIGAVTLRMEPRAASELLAILGKAIARHAEGNSLIDAAIAALSFRSGSRGDA